MNWYRMASSTSSRIDNSLKRLIDDYSDQGLKIWRKNDAITISVGDWAEYTEEIKSEVARISQSKNIRCESELGDPGFGWRKI